MRSFEHTSPSTKEDAVALLNGESAVLAGGTDLLSLMKDDVVAPKRIVNIKNIPELQGIHYDLQKGLTIGALATLDELLADPKVRNLYPALHQAAEGVSSPQVRAMGTAGGDLLQRPRCWYFRNGFGLLAQTNGKSMVAEGDNRYHAILGNRGSAYFVNPSSLAPALIALGARVALFGPEGSREVSLEHFYRTPQSAREKEYDLGDREILTHIHVPSASGKTNATYEVREKQALDWPLAVAAVSLQLQDQKVRSARLVLGHVAPVPWLSAEASASLVAKRVSAQSAQEAALAALKGAKPLSRNRYKIQLAQVAVKRAILRATGVEV